MVFICLKACFTQAISRTPLNGEREPHARCKKRRASLCRVIHCPAQIELSV